VTLDERGRQRALTALVTATGGLGTAAVGAALWWTAANPKPLTLALLLVLVTTALTDVTAVDVRRGREVESYTWGELPVLLGLALLPVEHLLLTSIVYGVAYLAAGVVGMKWVHNVGSYAIGLALAAGTVHLIAVPDWDRPAASAAALATGVAVFSVWNKVAIDAAIALAQGRGLVEVIRSGWTSSAAVFACSVGLALATLSVAQVDPALLAVAPGFIVVTALLNRWYVRNAQDRAAWSHLESAGRDLAALDTGRLAHVALTRVAALMQADGAELRLRDGSQDIVYRLEEGRAVRSREARADLSRTLAVTVVRDQTDPRAPSVRTTAAVPLSEEEPLGSVFVHYDAEIRLSRRERSQLVAYAGMVGVAAVNARLHERVRAQAEENEHAALHDALTSLPNRRLLRRRVQEAIDRGHAFALLLVDLDRFKPVNDRYGHAAGDVVLRATAGRMRAAVRPTDTVARTGGDEFVVLVDNARETHGTVDRLRTVLDAPIDVGEAVVSVGGSIGVALHPVDGSTVDELLNAADDAMYAQKAHHAPRTGGALDAGGSVVPIPRRSNG
jgi:diguanylate cyclase